MTMDEQKKVVLDSEAERLFEQLGGLEAHRKTQPAAGTGHMADGLLEEQKRHDAVRIRMVQATWLISRYLESPHYAGNDAQEARVFEKLAGVLGKLVHGPGHLGCLLIRYRGSPRDPQMPERFDYELIMGHTTVDSRITPHMARRNGPQWSRLPDQFQEACAILADYGVNNLFIRLPGESDADPSQLKLCLKILSGFRHSRQSGASIVVNDAGGQHIVPLINDENMFPDPNLTLLAGLNRLSARAMEAMVEKVDRWLRQKAVTSAVQRYAGVYNAAIELPKIRAQVKKPPIELNNVKWLISDTEDQAVSSEKVHIAKLALGLAGASPQKVAKMIQSVYADDFAGINKSLLGERLHLSSDLLHAADQRPQEVDLSKELLGNLQERLDLVNDTVMDEIHVVERTDAQVGRAPSPNEVHSQVYRMVSFYKGRSATRKKMVGMVHQPMAFTDRDYEILAKDFQIDDSEARELVKRLKGCFNAEGAFKKSAFADAVDLFRRYENKIFNFLWHHMKDVVLPGDRAAFLNALQSLTARMDQPKKAFKILLEDLTREPETIQASDIKTIMLANLIVHREKSITDYDVTPEDIVLSRHSIDKVVAEYAAWRIIKDHEAFSTKVRTIHGRLIDALHKGHSGSLEIPASVLLNLERELFIFLSMVECDTAKAILKSAADEYGDPAAALFHQNESENLMGALLQNLRVAVRGVGCVGGMPEVPLLERIKTNEETFMRLKKDRNYRSQARLITDWVDEAVKFIKFRC
jgi:hypothetical protein